MSLLHMRQRWQQRVHDQRMIQERIAILSTFTVNPVVPYFGLALDDANMATDIRVGPYNQIMQECLNEESETHTFRPTVLVVWARLEELWAGHALPLSQPITTYIQEALELADAILHAVQHWNISLLFLLPAIPEERPLGIGDACNASGIFATATAVREALRQRLAPQPGVLLLDVEEAIRMQGSASAYNRRLLALAHIPFTENVFHLVGTRLAQLLLLRTRPARKIVILDGDNTLWGGVVGEDGAMGVDLDANGPGASYVEFQAFLLELQHAGLLLALCSKNEEADVWEVFARPEMRLKRQMLATWRIGWQAKSTSILTIVEELKLGIDSAIYIDDNAAEIAEIQAAFPRLACILMPADPADWLDTLRSTSLFDRLPPLAEDLARTYHYQQEHHREVARASSSPQAYLAQLHIEVRQFCPSTLELPRIAQLIAKTNQFNLNCRRRSTTEIASLCTDPHYLLRLTHVRDRFGDYGIVGVCIARQTSEHLEIDTFALSCRAMGRSIEDAMLLDIATFAGRQQPLIATVEICPRNEPARTFFARMGAVDPGNISELHRPFWPSHIKRLEQEEQI
jgi:FkbH-like protein